MSNRLIVLGNGPSLRGVDFEMLRGEHTFMLNASYRAFDRIKLCPTYFGCFDFIVTHSHMVAYFELMNARNDIQQFFWVNPMLAHDRATVAKLERTREPTALGDGYDPMPDMGNSGANACQCGSIMGYDEIVLLGVDCRYVEAVEGCTETQGHLLMDNTPEVNPNYWFDDYQSAGDRYNKPQTDKFQMPGWERFARLAKDSGLKVTNCTDGSALECFPLAKLEDVL